MKKLVLQKSYLKKLTLVVVATSALLLGVWVNLAAKSDFVTLDNQKYTWSSLQGRWVVVNYFAEWCVPCLREIPELNEFHHQNNQGILLFGLSFDEVNKQQLTDLKDKYQIQFPLIEDIQNIPWGHTPSSLPTTYIIGADGKVKKQLKGEQSATKLLAMIAHLQSL